METKDYLTNYYERYDENGRLISKHGMVEYLTTMRYVEKYLKPNMRVLEIGLQAKHNRRRTRHNHTR